MTTPAPAVWSDGDPLMTAIAAAVSEQCETHPEQGLTVDDPRTIAAVAATVARQVLGTPTTDPVICVHPEGYEGECPCPPSCTCCNVSAAALQPASAPAAPADRGAGPETLSALMATIQELRALQQPLVDGLRFIWEDMDRVHKGGDEWATEWMAQVWQELPLQVRAVSGDTDAAQELANEARRTEPATAATEEPQP